MKMQEIKMLGGKFKYVLGSIFLLVFLVLVAEAGFYFGVTRKEGIIPSVSLPFEAPGAAPIIDQDRIPGFEFIKRGMVKGITIETQLEGTVTKIKGPEWFSFEKSGDAMGYRVRPEEPSINYTILDEDTGEGTLGTWQDLKVGDRIMLTTVYDSNTGDIISHSLTIFR